MTDDERFAGRYREQAIYRAARHQMRPQVWELTCGGPCHKRITATENDDNLFMRRREAEHRLAERAMKECWDTDSSGRLACPECHQEMLRQSAACRKARMAGTADAQGEGG